MVKDAVQCDFHDAEQMPKIIRLHFVRDEVLACKALMREGGIIASDSARHPWPSLSDAARAGLIEIARRLDPLVLRWGR